MIEEITNLDFDTKMKFWLHYMIKLVALNHDFEISEVNEFNKKWFDKIDYPILSATKTPYGFNFKPICFFDWIDLKKCSKKVDYGLPNGVQINYSGIYDYYSKFKNELNL